MIAVAISIDTEADHRGHIWQKTSPLRFDSITCGIPQRLTPVFAAIGGRPTYLLTTEVLNDAACVDVLRSLADCELGTHLHGDHVEPAARVPAAGAQSSDFTCFYPAELERGKLETITRQFSACFDRAPVSYRAGRYAASGRTAAILSQMGYRVETSVTPGIEWIHESLSEARLDFRKAPRLPYHPSEADLCREGALSIWEVPITTMPDPRWWRFGSEVWARLRRRTTRPRWLRPSTTPWPWLESIVRRTLKERSHGDVLFNVMFHSMEIVPGASPYSPTPATADRVVSRLSRLLQLFARLDARFVTLEELAALLDAGELRFHNGARLR
jgi:hypothetical protein